MCETTIKLFKTIFANVLNVILRAITFSLVPTRFDYDNSVLADLPIYTWFVDSLQSVLNAAARLTYHLHG